LDQAELVPDDRGTDLLLLDSTFQELEAINPWHARVVECRSFAGLSVEETADALGISAATVKRDWSMARAWLNRELSICRWNT